jgi:hypothetical protein
MVDPQNGRPIVPGALKQSVSQQDRSCFSNKGFRDARLNPTRRCKEVGFVSEYDVTCFCKARSVAAKQNMLQQNLFQQNLLQQNEFQQHFNGFTSWPVLSL